jgi:hypothetical protein
MSTGCGHKSRVGCVPIPREKIPTWRVFKQLRTSAPARSTSSVRTRKSALSRSRSQMYRRRSTRNWLGLLWKRTIRACWRRGRNAVAYRSLQMQMMGRRNGRAGVLPGVRCFILVCLLFLRAGTSWISLMRERTKLCRQLTLS